MNPIATADTTTVLSGRSDWIGAEGAKTLAHHPLASIETEFPHYVRSIDSADGVERPKERHPVFYGCYDWHSAVHSHWALVRQLRLFDDHPRRAEIVERIDRRLTRANVEQEVERFEGNEAFEQPYGWAWLLHLAAELRRWDDPRADEWCVALEPLERTVTSLVESEFLTQERPLRVGTHGNSAFALHCVLDYARTIGDGSLASRIVATASDFYADDHDAPLDYEPLGWDFLSPSLTEADLMQRIYDRDEFVAWVERFFPDVTTGSGDGVLSPVTPDEDPNGGVAHHLAGLNLSRAWCLAGIASSLAGHPFSDVFERDAKRHVESGLSQAFTDDYAGSHWLSSFVLYLLTRNEAGIAPE